MFHVWPPLGFIVSQIPLGVARDKLRAPNIGIRTSVIHEKVTSIENIFRVLFRVFD
jgi:hypothetical protein